MGSWRAGIAAQTGMDLIPVWINLLKIQLAFLVSIHLQLRKVAQVALTSSACFMVKIIFSLVDPLLYLFDG